MPREAANFHPSPRSCRTAPRSLRTSRHPRSHPPTSPRVSDARARVLHGDVVDGLAPRSAFPCGNIRGLFYLSAVRLVACEHGPRSPVPLTSTLVECPPPPPPPPPPAPMCLVAGATSSPSDTATTVPTSFTATGAYTPPVGMALVPLPRRTLVVYVFSNSDPHYFGNMEYFITHAVRAHQNIDYVFIINQHPLKGDETAYDPTSEEWHPGLIEERHLPKLPPNAQYVEHINECFDLGTVRWFLDTADYARDGRHEQQ